MAAQNQYTPEFREQLSGWFSSRWNRMKRGLRRLAG